MSFHHTYSTLPALFFAEQNPETSRNPKTILYNTELADELGISEIISPENAHAYLSGNMIPDGAKPLAQAYMGHQFGYPNMLGDGRALLLTEWQDKTRKLWDIALKGSGRTPFSRGGDGRATLRSMLREYLISEAMYHLRIPTSRNLAVVETGLPIYREIIHAGAILTRVMSSHIRIGTFEFAKQFGSTDDMQALIDYTIERHYRELRTLKNPTLGLLEKVIAVQIDLIIEWLRVGFIHGVINTDNTSIGGETFDYGPCAFLNTFHPQQVFSSIDTQGRYAFGNQANIILWNLSVFASTLSDFIEEASIQKVLGTMGEQMHSKWLAMMCRKIGISSPLSTDEPLVRELLATMQETRADYTNTFLYLVRFQDIPESACFEHPRFQNWISVWHARLERQTGGLLEAQKYMAAHNPVYIPRNHLVEQVLDQAVSGDMQGFHEFLKILQNPYTRQDISLEYMQSPKGFDAQYETFCGT